MVVKKCPHCTQRYPLPKNTSDYIHRCAIGNTTIDNEDEFDITASFFAGNENKLFGTDARANGASKVQTVTERGNRRNTHFTRQREVYIDHKNNTWNTNG